MTNTNEPGGEGPAPAMVMSGLKVVDFSRLLPGPWCTQMMADFGADVIKVEQPGIGDGSRHNPPHYKKNSVYYNSVNRNKRGIALDLSKSEGRQVAHRLIADADVVLESYRVGVVEKLEIDYATAKRLNERVIYCSISGFGQDGPLAPIPGHDLVIQAVTGIIGVNLERGEAVPPVPAFQAGDYAAGALALIGIMVALMRRGQTGEGRYIDCSMFDGLFSMANIALSAGMARDVGFSGLPQMESWGGNPRYNHYATKDGKAVAISLLEAKLWREFCEIVGRQDLVDENESPADRHTTHGDRGKVYEETLTAYCGARTRDEIVEELTAIGAPICPIYTPQEAVVGEHARHRGLIEYVDTPKEGRIPQIGNPLAGMGLSDSKRRHAPDLGEDSDAILEGLNFSSEEIAQFKQSGALG
jgi:crotonobetainyl-CoA:carnitine CoA-transferase CaiB-like acyl-CoA transferase